MARRQELLQKQNINRIDMEINAMYHQREMDKSHRKGFVDMDSPFLYHGLPSNQVAFRGRQMCPEGQLSTDMFVHRNALDILHGSTILKTSPYTPINSLQRERVRRPGRRTGNPKMTENNIGVPKIPADNKPQSSPSATEEEKEEKKEEDTEAFNRCDQGKMNTESATDKSAMDTQDSQDKSNNPTPVMSNRSRTGADKELTNPGPTFEDRYIYQSPVHLSTSPFSFPVTMNPTLLPGTHGLFLNREEIPTLQDIHKWSSQDVYNFVSSLPGCSAYAQVNIFLFMLSIT
ncbi:hypothetical protein GDO81_007585 [Engystomops pustulosus]|uniref:Sterile alpha motif domain containing 7 n=1 Tax=Engystomops pustulosus TaxID=76066 RepID=A0AAV7C9W7_ENGPU|nr:hypothetical protein GDO81_007585 [Engystomops pustulosus]